MRIKMLQR